MKRVPSEDDSFDDDVSETARLEVQAAHAPHQIVPAPPTLSHRPAILVQPRQAILFGRLYRIHPNAVYILLTARKRVRAPPALSPATKAAIAQWIAMPPPLSSGSSSKYSSSSMLGSSSSASSSPYTRPSRKRSHISYSSPETSHPSSSPPPHKRCRVLIYSSSSASLPPSPSVGPSRKRCRSPTRPLLSITTISTSPIEMLPPCERFKGRSSALQEDVHAKTTVEARLGDHSDMIGEMYEHLLDIPLTRLETTEHELETLRARVVSSKRDCFFARQGRVRYPSRRTGWDMQSI
nr:hypothetical protein [Tanacetum cinerariifolium]